MRRDEVLEHVLQIHSPYILLQYPTGYGKSRLAIERVKKDIIETGKVILIVVYRNVHKKNWKNELEKWWPNYNQYIRVKFTTYAGIHNMIDSYDYIIYDECHHLTERCLSVLKNYHTTHAIFLSATVSDRLIQSIRIQYKTLYVDKIRLREAIEDEVLPDPMVYLIPMTLKNDIPTEYILRNPKAKGRTIECSWANRWNFIRQKDNKVRIFCTQHQYVQDLNRQIDYWKRRALRTHSEITKNKWLRLCSERLKYLSNIKTPFVKELLEYLKDYRTLTFCNSIEHTEILGHYCINSKNTESERILDDFNDGSINHITACNMLNEGINLYNCRIGLYANLNSSEIIIKQRAGRLLRHPNPIIIIPYFINTREEEIVKTMLENYNPDLVTIVKSIKEIKI